MLYPMMIAVEGQVMVKLANIPWPTSVMLLLGTFDILNIEYPPGFRNLFAFSESITLGRHDMAKKRVSIQKFFKELDCC